MKITVESQHKITEVYALDLQDRSHHIELDHESRLDDGWYQLHFPYTGQKNEISDIKINGESIGNILYTGFYVDGNGNTHQPACAMWDDKGIFKIWIHTQLGVLFQRFLQQIANNKFGKNLFTDYLLTVDRPVILKKQWPESIKTFFSNGDGPNWWDKTSSFVPYKILENITVSKEDLLRESKTLCNYNDKIFNGKVIINSVRESCNPELPFYRLDKKLYPNFAKLVEQIGFKNLLTIDTQVLEPNSFLRMHKDDDYQKDVFPYIRGCKKFYWTLTEDKDCFFKIGKSGLLPLNKPTLINNVDHVHSVVSERDSTRTILSIYGEIIDDK
mgnify:CR=1 FL=1